MPDRMLSTGELAEACNVSRDTVLKWIKCGKIVSYSTPGGHHRIPASAIGDILKSESAAETHHSTTNSHLYCWEYRSQGDANSESCQECLVYRCRALRCFDLVAETPESRVSGLACNTDCKSCDYYQLVHNRAVNVMIISDGIESLRQRCDHEVLADCNIMFVDSGYKCCLAMDNFRPDFIFVDRSLEGKQRETLIRDIMEDKRLPNARIVVNEEPGQIPTLLRDNIFAYQRGPITSKSVADIIGALRRTRPHHQ